eukprot:2135107-Ditylum_brightwellii.AAC.2
MPLMHLEHDIGGEGGGGYVGEEMVHKKVSAWDSTKHTNFCPLKPMQWLQRAHTFPNTQKGGGL